MDSMVTVFELQNDFSVKQSEVLLTFPRVSKSRLCIVTNQNAQLHLFNNSAETQRTEEGAVQEKSIFQYGVSTKVFAIMDATGIEWEVRVLLSPSEISRLSSNFNLTGFVRGCLTMEKYQDSFMSLGDYPKHVPDVQELCMVAAQFLSYSDDHIVNDYCKELNRILTQKVRTSCIGHQKMVNMMVGALVTLAAAELATSVGGTRSFDYRVEKEKTYEDQSEQIRKMFTVFDVMADLLTVSNQGMRMQIIFRNPCPDNWASGGKKLVKSGETFVFGLCHKLVSISEAESEIQFLQNLQESYDLIPVFHLPAFVEQLLMTWEWRNKIELFLKEQAQRKEIIQELSSLARRFICSSTCDQETFLNEFQSKMLEKWSSVEVFLVGDEVVCSFGILVAILAAVTVKSNVNTYIPNSEEVEDPEEATAEFADTCASATTKNNISTGLLSTSDNSLSSYEIITHVKDENAGAQPDLCRSSEDWVKVDPNVSEVVIGGAESKIGSTNDPETTDQGSFNGRLKTVELLLAKSHGVTALDIADEVTGNNKADENLEKYPGVKDCVHESSPTSPEAEEDHISQRRAHGPNFHDSKNDCKVAQPPSVGARDNAHESCPTIPKSEECHPNKCSVGCSNLHFYNNDGVYRAAHGTSVGAEDDSHVNSPTSPKAEGRRYTQGNGGSPSQDYPSDYGVYTAAKGPSVGAAHDSYVNGATSPKDEGRLYTQSNGGSPSLDYSNDYRVYRAAKGPSIGAGDDSHVNTVTSPKSEVRRYTQTSGSSPRLNYFSYNTLESQNSFSRNSIFTCFVGLICLLVFAMLCNMLPESVISVLITIILALLVAKWSVSQQP